MRKSLYPLQSLGKRRSDSDRDCGSDSGHKRRHVSRQEDSPNDSPNPKYSLAWREFALQRKCNAKLNLGSKSESAERECRRRGLLPPEAPGEGVLYPEIVGIDDSFRMLVLPDGDRVVNLSHSGRLQVSSVSSGTLLWRIRAQRELTQLALGAIGNDILVTASRAAEMPDVQSASGLVRTWRVDSGEALGEICLPNFLVSSMAAVDIQRFAAGCHNGDIVICEHDNGARLMQLARVVLAENPIFGHSQAPGDLSRCAGRLASASGDTISLWDISTRGAVLKLAEIDVESENPGDYVVCLDVTDTLVAVGCCNAPHVRVYSVPQGYSCISSGGAVNWIHNREVTSILILDSDHVLTASEDRTIAISALRSQDVIVRIGLEFEPVSARVLFGGSIAVIGYNVVVILPAPNAAASLLRKYANSLYRSTSNLSPIPLQAGSATFNYS